MATPLGGDPILASDGIRPLYIQKAAAETVNNSATLQNDDDFAITLQPGTYHVQLFLHVTCTSNAADIKTAWAFSGTVVNTGRSVMMPPTTSTDALDTNMRWSGNGFSTATGSGVTTTTTNVLHEDLLFTVTVAGILQFQWAQNTATVVDTVATTASRMYVTPVELQT